MAVASEIRFNFISMKLSTIELNEFYMEARGGKKPLDPLAVQKEI